MNQKLPSPSGSYNRSNFIIRSMKPFTMVLLALLFTLVSHATTRTSTAAGGTWSSTSTWVGGVVPASTDAVVIATTGTGVVTISSTTTCNSLVINSGSKLQVNRNFTVTTTSSITGTIAFGSTSGTSRTITFTGDVTLNSGATWTELASGNGANDKFTFAGNFTNNATTYTGVGTGVHTFSGATKTLSGSTATTIKSMAVTGTYTNNISTTLTVSTALTGAGTLTQGTNAYLYITGTATITTLSASAAGNTVNYNGAAQTAKVATYLNLTLSTSGVKTFSTTPTVNGVLSMEGTATITVTTGVVTYGASATLQYNTTTARTASTEEWITPFAATGGIIIKSTGAITMPGASVLNTSVPLTINSGATLTPGANLLTLGGNFTISGTGVFTSGSGGVTITGNATQSIAGFTTTGTVSMTKTGGTATMGGAINGAAFTINGSGGTLDLASYTHTFTGNVTLTAGTLLGTASIINVNSSATSAWNGTGSVFSAGTSTVIFGGTAQSIAATTTFNNLTLTTSGAKNIPTGVTVTVNAVLSMEGTTTLTTSGSGALAYGASATLQYKGTSAQTTGTEFPASFAGSGGVIINNSNGVSLNSARTLTSASKLTLTSGLFTTTSTNLLTVQNTATTAISTGTTTTFINGPVKWSIGTGTYVFPVGATSTNYFPFTIATTASSSPVITVQAFNTDPGTPGTFNSPILALSHTEYWQTTLNSGTFTGSISLARQTGLGVNHVVGQSSGQAGTYNSIGGTVSGASILNSNAISSLGYFNMCANGTCPTYSLLTTSTSGICSGTAATVNVTANTANLPVNLYSVTYNVGSPNTATALVTSMNVTTAGSGSFTTSNLASNGSTLITITQINSGTCTSSISANNTATTLVAASATPTVTIAVTTGANPECSGSSITFTATAANLNSGTVSNYNFNVNGSSVQSSTATTYTNTTLANGDLVTCIITVTGGSCLSATTATSNTITMTVNPNITPLVSLDLTTGTNPSCAGSTVVFIGTPSSLSGGTVSNYQFLVNGVSKQTGAATTYTTSTLNDNDLVKVIITVTGGTCLTATTAFDTTTMNISPLPAGIINANGPFCTSGAGTLTYTDTLSVSPFTIIYSDGVSNRTSTNDSTGVAFATFTTPVTSTTIYTLVSVTDDLGCVSTSGFTKAKDTITIYTAPTASNAGTNQAQCNNGSFTLAGNAASVGTGTWAVVSGTATITSIHSATSTVTAVPAGTTATLSWTIVNGVCSTTSNVTLTNDASVTATSGTNQAQCNSGSFTLAGNSPNSGGNPATGTGAWTCTSGCAGVTITTPTSNASTVTGVAAGTPVTLKWTVTNGTCSANSSITLTNDIAPTASNAGTNQAQCNSGSFTLAGNAASAGTGTWAVVSGTATITSIHSATSTVTAVPSGSTATLSWTIVNGTCSTTSNVTLTNNASVTATSGSNQAQCNSGSFTLAGNSPNSGGNPATGTGAWTCTSGCTGVTIATPTSNVSTVTGVVVGTPATLKWTVTN